MPFKLIQVIQPRPILSKVVFIRWTRHGDPKSLSQGTDPPFEIFAEWITHGQSWFFTYQILGHKIHVTLTYSHQRAATTSDGQTKFEQACSPINLLYLSMSLVHLKFLSTSDSVEPIDQLTMCERFQSLHQHYDQDL